MRKPYNTYDFNPDSSFKPMQRCCSAPNVTVDVDIEEIKKAIDEKLDETVEEFNNTIDEKLGGDLNYKLNKISHKIEHAEHHIIEEIKEHSIDDMCFCHFATKEDINKAVKSINDNTRQVFDEIDFDEKFEDLNKQLKDLKDNE